VNPTNFFAELKRRNVYRAAVAYYGELRLHPRWDPLRGDPRFEKFVASLAPKAPNK
jgi:hypothetical protein